MTRIITTNTLLPEYVYTSAEATEFYKGWVSNQSESFQKKAARIFENAEVKEKHIVAPIETLFKQRSFEESNDFYRKKAIEYGTRILSETIEKAGIKPEEIDLIITTSCTGYMIPSFDAYLVNNLGLRTDVKRLPITELGCAAGVAALIYANDFLKAYPDKKVAVITLEFTSNTIQLNDFSWDNIIGTAIFSDGVGCVILGGDDCRHPEIIDGSMNQVLNTTEVLGYNIKNTGLLMNLDKSIPSLIENNFEKIVVPFLKKNNLTIEEVDNWLTHPGGVKILSKMEKILNQYGKNIDISRKVMETYGNMSSSTIIFILDEYMKQKPRNELGYLLSFGPGFSANQLIVKWS